MRCIVDCRRDNRLLNDFLELSLWGKPCYAYAIEAVKKAGCFSEIGILTDSRKISDYCNKHYADICIATYPIHMGEDVFLLSGRAPCITSATVRHAVEQFCGTELISARNEAFFDFEKEAICFYEKTDYRIFNAFSVRGGVNSNKKALFFHVPDREAVVINTPNDFELALVLKKKQENRAVVLQMIERKIKEKEHILLNALDGKSICLVGHSQFDQWDVVELAGFKVRNCGISGISSFEYEDYILKNNHLNCNADIFLMMHGTNDIVWDYTLSEMVSSIGKNVEYIRKRNAFAPIIFLACLHTNGRMDRSNGEIDKLNRALKEKLADSVIWLDTSFMDDGYGDLRAELTPDGLHINEKGYQILKVEVENVIRRIQIEENCNYSCALRVERSEG